MKPVTSSVPNVPTMRVFVAVLALAALSACSAGPPALSVEPAPDSPWGLVPLDVRVYLAEVERYASTLYVAYAPQMAVADLEDIVAVLEALDPPDEVQPAHELLLKGYRAIAEGRRLMVENIGDNVLQAEARSLTSFGQVKLQEHVQLMEAYLASFGVTPTP